MWCEWDFEPKNGIVSKLPETTEFIPGEDLVIECEVGSSIVKGYWFKDNQMIKYKLNENDSQRIEVTNQGKVRKLIIAEAEPSDSGIYTCKTELDATSTEVVVDAKYSNPSFFRSVK